jgi:hypothetical protein
MISEGDGWATVSGDGGRRFSEVIDIARRRLGDGGRATVLYTTYIWSSPALMARARPKHSNELRRPDKCPAKHRTQSDRDCASVGRTRAGNVVVACHSCNSGKRDRIIVPDARCAAVHA